MAESETTEGKDAQNHQLGDISDNSGIYILDIIHDFDFDQMLDNLSKDERTLKIHDWTALTTDDLKGKFESKQLMNEYFRKHELQVCVKTIKVKLQEHGINCNQNWPKYKIIDLFTSLHSASVKFFQKIILQKLWLN